MTAAADATPGDGAAPAELDQAPAVEGSAGGEQDAAAGASSRPRKGDKPPRKRPKVKRARRAADAGEPTAAGAAGAMPKGAALKAQSAKLEAAIAEVLVFPAVPAMMFAPDETTRAYLPEHFTRMGPKTAHELVAASERSPELRAMLERIAYGSSMATVVFAMLAYVAPPVMWVVGMRQQAANITMMAGMDESELAAGMMAARATAEAAAQNAQDAAGAPDGGAADAAAAAAGADPLEH